MNHLINKSSVQTPIIPQEQIFINAGEEEGLDFKEIAVFAAIGFFLGDASYYTNVKCLQPATKYSFNHDGGKIKAENYFKWNYQPRDISLKVATEEFAHLFDKICKKNLQNKRIILPLSGGLDSRSQATVIKDEKNVFSYSYKFHDSFDETSFGKKIAEINGWDFKDYIISPGYLWSKIDELAEINQCYTDFVTPRQMGIFDEYDSMGDVFFLGHWGDVLFDDMGVNDDISLEEQVEVIVRKIVKKGGLELGNALWNEWGIEGALTDYIKEKVSNLLSNIKIDNANSRIRAFKSMYWAPRWTSVSLEVFKKKHPLYLPYYDDEMCKFICGVPEDHLAQRKIQIEYIKMTSPELAKVPWQSYAPLNLYNYKDYYSVKNLPIRTLTHMKRRVNRIVGCADRNYRNWEIQYLGKDNPQKLSEQLFYNGSSENFISNETKSKFLDKFMNAKEKVNYAHPINMLLTLSVFHRKFLKS